MALKNGTKSNFEKNLSSEVAFGGEDYVCQVSKKNCDKKVQKLESGFLEQGCVFLKVNLKQPEFLEFIKNFRF